LYEVIIYMCSYLQKKEVISMPRNRKGEPLVSWVLLGLLLGALLMVGVQASSPAQIISLQDAVKRGFVRLENKGEYFGDAVTFIATGYADQEYRVQARAGDIILNKAGDEQNLVVTKTTLPEDVRFTIRPGERKRIEGIFTACIDAHKGAPSFDRVMDIGPNLYNWGGGYEEAAKELLRVLEVINREGLWEYGPAQRAIWCITDDEFCSHEEVLPILEEAEVDPYKPHGFPRLSDPNAGSPDSGYTVPKDQYGYTISTKGGEYDDFLSPPPLPIPAGANENFETGDFSRFPWISHGWEVTDDNPHSGWFSAKAYIGTLEITLATGEGILSFWIDSNCSGDLRLWMDGHEIGSWSDDCDWHQVEIPIHGGTHTFVWESYDYDDPYWLDDISFPVAGVGVGVCPCPTGLRVPQDYSTIGAAIKAASPSECINVGPGTYREELWIDKDIILCGAGADVTTIEGKITIASGAPRIEGFRITGSYSGIVVNHYTRPTIQYNIIEYNDFGILIWSLSEPTISYNVIRYNHSCGISIDETERTTVAGTGNEIYGNGQDLCPSEAAFPPGFRK
jgi:parallel beta-helix repeat protein